MFSIKYLIVICIAVLMVGCAGYGVKPAMPDPLYDHLGEGAHQVQRCGDMGMMSPELAAFGTLYLQSIARQYSFDMDRLIASSARMREVNQESCNKVAVFLATEQQRSAQQTRYVQPAPQPNYSLPARTVCNNIAGQILCSTY